MGDTTNPGAIADTQYTQPKQNQSSFFGPAYANEGDPSWEDVIAMVVIPGSPARIKQAAGDWTVLLQRVAEVERVLKAIQADLESWKGPGGEEYRNHLTTMITAVQKIIDDHTTLPHYLENAASDLETAIAGIPIPDDMVHEVMAAKQGYIDSGMISGAWGPNAIYSHLLPLYGNKWLDEARELFSWGWAERKLRDWISSQDDKAIKAYHKLANDHVKTMANIPGTDPVDLRDPRSVDPFTQPKIDGPGGGGGGGLGGMPKGGGMPGAGGGIPGGGGAGLDPMANLPHSNIADPNLTDPGGGSGSGYNMDDMPGSGLAGAGGGIGGLGPGAGGIGSGIGGLGSGAGGGLGAGGLGAGAGGLGRGAGMGGGLGGGMPGMGMGGAGAGRAGAGRGVGGAGAGKGSGVRGAGAGRAGAGAGGLRGGMMPGAGGAHGAGGEGEDHATWLEEDDDPWGSDSEAPPSVLG